jgi:uncharacterized membrane protein
MRSRAFHLLGIAAVSFSLAALTLQAHAAGGTLVSTLFGSSALSSLNFRVGIALRASFYSIESPEQPQVLALKEH